MRTRSQDHNSHSQRTRQSLSSARRHAERSRLARAARSAILASRRVRRASNLSSDSIIVRDHYRRMRSPRHPIPFQQTPEFAGIREFNSYTDDTQEVKTFAQRILQHDDIIVTTVMRSYGKKRESENTTVATTVTTPLVH